MILLKNLMMNESLTEYEKNLIYGNLLENINDVVIMNEAYGASVLSSAISLMKHDADEDSKNAITRGEKIRANVKRDSYVTKALQLTKKVIEKKNEENKDPLYEDMENINRNRLKNIQLNMKKTRENADIKIRDLEKRAEATRNNIERAKAAKEAITTSPDGKTQIRESTQPSANPTEFLFKTKDESGKLLDHFINKKSLQEYSLQQLAQDLESNSEAQAIIKKIEFYIRKMGSGLDYDSYIDLKVQNGKFKALVKKTKEDRLNKIRS